MSVRVLHLIASNFIGGPEKQILHHAKDMVGSRYQVEIASFQDETVKPEILGAAARIGLRATCLPGGMALASFRGLGELLRDRKIDILCTHGYKANFLGHLATKDAKTAHIAFVRGWTAETWRVAIYERLERWALSSVPTVVCVSKKQAEQLAPMRRDMSAPVVVPNAMLAPYRAGLAYDFQPSRKPKIPTGAFVFGSVGRLSAEKGHRFLLDAFADLRREFTDANLILIVLGDGRELAHLKAQALRLGIADSVLFAGFQRDCGEWMELLDCIVQPSLSEGLPNSLLEALHQRLPIIATAVGGVPDLIMDRENGLLVPAASSADLAAAMKEILFSPELRGRFATGADLVMSEYGPDVQREKLIAVYKSALKPKRGAGQVREVQRESAA